MRIEAECSTQTCEHSGTRSARSLFGLSEPMSVPAANETRADAVLFDRTGSVSGTERRRNPRAPLHWTLYLACNGSGQPLRTTTRDINKDGFYCSLDQPVRPGERIRCDIVLPTHGPRNPDDVVYLRCRVQAVRVEKVGAGMEFGLACRIEDFSVIRVASPRLRLQENGNEVWYLPVGPAMRLSEESHRIPGQEALATARRAVAVDTDGN